MSTHALHNDYPVFHDELVYHSNMDEKMKTEEKFLTIYFSARQVKCALIFFYLQKRLFHIFIQNIDNSGDRNAYEHLIININWFML